VIRRSFHSTIQPSRHRQGKTKMTQFSGPSAKVGVQYSGPIDVGPTTPVQLLPTVNVVRAGTVNPSNLWCINIIGGFLVTIQSAGLTTGQRLLIVATGGVSAILKLDNGGMVGGTTVYTLKPGNFLSVSFDGMNLS
jgi:hypothetical protein